MRIDDVQDPIHEEALVSADCIIARVFPADKDSVSATWTYPSGHSGAGEPLEAENEDTTSTLLYTANFTFTRYDNNGELTCCAHWNGNDQYACDDLRLDINCK